MLTEFRLDEARRADASHRARERRDAAAGLIQEARALFEGARTIERTWQLDVTGPTEPGSTERATCSCVNVCGDVPEAVDNPLAICKGLTVQP